MKNKNESVAVIYHKEDLDGALSAAIVKDYYGINICLYYNNYLYLHHKI